MLGKTQHAPAPVLDGPPMSKTCLSKTYIQFNSVWKDNFVDNTGNKESEISASTEQNDKKPSWYS